MEYYLKSKESAYPCEVTIDEDNGRYMIRKADSSGEVFNSPLELIRWVLDNWTPDEFQDQEQFRQMITEFQLNFLTN
ncbi:hypothetical protein ACLM5H_00370 [Fredinandcohnia humi]